MSLIGTFDGCCAERGYPLIGQIGVAPGPESLRLTYSVYVAFFIL